MVTYWLASSRSFITGWISDCDSSPSLLKSELIGESFLTRRLIDWPTTHETMSAMYDRMAQAYIPSSHGRIIGCGSRAQMLHEQTPLGQSTFEGGAMATSFHKTLTSEILNREDNSRDLLGKHWQDKIVPNRSKRHLLQSIGYSTNSGVSGRMMTVGSANDYIWT